MKPCPFCGTALNPVAGPNGAVSGFSHPKGACYYQGVFVGKEREEAWNKRASGLWMEVLDGVPSFNSEGRGQEVGFKMVNDIIEYYRDTNA